MVLLSNDNPIVVKKTYALKCLEKKNFDVVVVPVTALEMLQELNKCQNINYEKDKTIDIKSIKPK